MRVAASASWNSSAAVELFGSCRKYSIGRLSRSAMICSVRVDGRARPSSIWLRNARLKSFCTTAARLSPSSIRAFLIRGPSWSGVRGLRYRVPFRVANLLLPSFDLVVTLSGGDSVLGVLVLAVRAANAITEDGGV